MYVSDEEDKNEFPVTHFNWKCDDNETLPLYIINTYKSIYINLKKKEEEESWNKYEIVKIWSMPKSKECKNWHIFYSKDGLYRVIECDFSKREINTHTYAHKHTHFIYKCISEKKKKTILSEVLD